MLKAQPTIRKTVFWDVDVNAVDYTKNFEWVICRVFNRGNLNEVVGILSFYGWAFVKKVLIGTELELQENAIDLAKGIFQLSDKNFRCLDRKL